MRSLDPEFVWQDLSAAQRQQIEARLTRFVCQPGQPIYQPSDRGEVLFWVLQGAVELYRYGEKGQKQVVKTFGEPVLVGEMALLGVSLAGCYVAAVGPRPCEVAALSHDDVTWIILHYPAVALRLITAVGEG